MNRHLTTLYEHMPASVQNLFASARGYQLRRWRYGSETDDLMQAALERDTWSVAQWQSYREERLAYMLERAVRHVPYYRDQWAQRRQNGDRAAVDVLENWAILEKEPVRQHPDAFIADDVDQRALYALHTSGTTGTPIKLWWSKSMVRQHYALHEARARRWYGVDRHTPFAMLGGQLVAPIGRTTPPFWVKNYAMHQLYMSSYHLSPHTAPLYVQAMRDFDTQFILAYTSSLYTLAQMIKQSGVEPPRLRAIITNAEPLYDYQRALIESAFNCRVYETFGQAESVAFGSECTAGNLHMWLEVGWVEIMAGDQPLPIGATGDIVTTGLMNDAMPLIRYRLGDRASLAVDAGAPCDHTLPRWGRIEGRSDDVLYTRDGRRIGRLDPIFKSDLPIKEAQIIQKSLDLIVVKLVPAEGFSQQHERYVAEQFHQRMGAIQVTFEQVDTLPRTSNGKFRAVINELPAEEKARLIAGQSGG